MRPTRRRRPQKTQLRWQLRQLLLLLKLLSRQLGQLQEHRPLQQLLLLHQLRHLLLLLNLLLHLLLPQHLRQLPHLFQWQHLPLCQ